MSKSRPLKSSVPDDLMAALSSTTRHPAQRIELFLEQIEEQARSTIAELTPGLAERQAAADRAQEELMKLDGDVNSADGKQLRVRNAAEKRFVDVHAAIYPLVWRLAQEALIDSTLVRDALATGRADEAVEAAIRAANAWWKLRTEILEGPIRYGLSTYKRRRAGGKKGAATRARNAEPRQEKIIKEFRARMASKDHPRAEIIKQLAHRYSLNVRTIRRIVSARTSTT